MMTFLRRQSQTVLVLILAVLGFSFLFYGSSGILTNTGGRSSSNDFGRIDGRDVTMAELSDAVRDVRNSLLLQGRAQDLTSPDVRKQVAEEAWDQLLIQAEADRLHLNVTDDQVVSFIQGIPSFQKDGVYSPEAYQTQLNNIQNSLHISPDAFENLMRNNLEADAVRRALFSSIHPPARDVAAQYNKYYGSCVVTAATLDPQAFAARTQVTPEDIEAEYKAHPENPAYRTKEKRKVDYVLINLPPEQAKLTGKDKTAALDALGEKALDFAVAFQPDPSASGTAPQATPDFMTEAKKRGLNTETTGFFATDEPPGGDLPPSPSFNSAAFELSDDNPVSKVVELDNGVAVLHLAGIQASDIRPLAEVQDVITKQLQQSKGQQAMVAAAQSTQQALQAAIQKGTPFAAAAAQLNLKVETLPAFIPAKVKPDNPVITDIAESVTRLEVGQVSPPVSGYDGSVRFVHLDSRAPGDPAGLPAFSARFQQSQTQQLQTLVLLDWANWRSRQPGNHKPPNLEQYGGVD